jgi:hypothetical protein
MVNRNTLHQSHLPEFETWLPLDGWTTEPAKGDYEVLRARKNGRLMIIYKRLHSQHLTVDVRFNGVVRAFIKQRKR